MSHEAPSTRKRRGGPKSRNGCRTCKIRRIKCDETKPFCFKCTSTGRRCDGYADSANTAGQIVFCMPATITSGGKIDAREARYLEIFRHVFIDDIFESIGTQKWRTNTMATVQSEPAVRHAAIALSAILKAHDVEAKHAETGHTTFSLQQYGLGMKAVKELMLDASSQSVQIILICAILSISYDILEGGHDIARVHLESALQICRTQKVDPEILSVLVRLDVQASTYISGRSPVAGASTAETTLCQTRGLDMTTMDIRLFSILIDVWTFLQDPIVGHARYDSQDALDRDLTDSTRTLLLRLEIWKTEFDDSSDLETGPRTLYDLQAARLELQYLASMVTLYGFLDKSESAYDSHDEEFKRMNTLARSLSGSLKLRHGSRSFSLGLGFVQPLSLVAQKCRSPQVRREALLLLRSSEVQEGVWNSAAVAAISELAMQFEEGDLVDVSLVLTRVPEKSRIHSIGTDIAPKARSAQVSFRTLPFGASGGWYDHHHVVSW